MPQEFVYFGNSWLKHHPGWAMHTWTDDYAAQLMDAETLQRSTAKSGKANVLRYQILARYGGVYIDTDFECLRNIEPLINNVSCFVGLQSPDVANNAIIGSVPGHAFMQDLVAHLPDRLKSLSGNLSINQSGPYYLSERLRGRSDVVVFSPALLYPYQWHERWRRHESFPGAYAVHHWSLSWRKRRRSVPCSSNPAISVLVVNTDSDCLRLNWVLEGLAEQTASGTFEVVVVDQTRRACVKELTMAFGSRLRIFYVLGQHLQRGLLSQDVQHCVRSCHGNRVIVLHGRCVPDPNLVEFHSQFGEDAIVGFSGQRFYPSRKIFPFAPPLDYDSLAMHSIPDSRYCDLKSIPVSASWESVDESCISVRRDTLLGMRLPSGIAVRAGGKWLARELSRRDHQVMAMPQHAQVTHLM